VFLAIARGINFNLFYDSDFFFLFISSFHVQWGVGCGNFHLSSSLLNKTIDVLLYVDRLDAYRVDNLDKQVVKAITDSFGKGIWNRAFIVLTHAQLSPPDGLPYEDFYSKSRIRRYILFIFSPFSTSATSSSTCVFLFSSLYIVIGSSY